MKIALDKHDINNAVSIANIFHGINFDSKGVSVTFAKVNLHIERGNEDIDKSKNTRVIEEKYN